MTIKKTLLLIISLFPLFGLGVFAQTQKGTTRLMNSGKKPIAGVQVYFSGAKATQSDANGIFRLVFSGKKAGDLVFMEKIHKAGYELVNRKELEVAKITNTSYFKNDIILAYAGTIEASKKQYYNISDKALRESFAKSKKKLRRQLHEALLSQTEFQKKYEELQKQFDLQQANLDKLADKFARTNFDDVSQVHKEALELFKAGKIQEALQKLESANLIGEAKKVIAEEQKIAQLENELEERKIEAQRQREKTVEALSLQADLHILNQDIKKAGKLYGQLIQLDSTNLDLLQKVADFYREHHYYPEAFALYPKIIQHPEAEDWQIANAYGDLGNLHETTGDLNKALENHTKCKDFYQKAYKQYPDDSFYQENLTISYAKLGFTHSSLGNLDKALQFFEEMNTLFKELYEAYPENVSFKDGLAISYQNLGETHSSLGNLDKALQFFEEYNRLEKELYESYPTQVSFKNGLAISYAKLGDTHSSLGNLEKALQFFEECHRLSKELYESYPENVSFKNSLAISYAQLGETHSSLGNLERSLQFFEEYNRLEKELYEAYPKNVSFKNGLTLSYLYLGQTYSKLNNRQETKKYYLKGKAMYEELVRDFPRNGFQNNLNWVKDRLAELE